MFHRGKIFFIFMKNFFSSSIFFALIISLFYFLDLIYSCKIIAISQKSSKRVFFYFFFLGQLCSNMKFLYSLVACICKNSSIFVNVILRIFKKFKIMFSTIRKGCTNNFSAFFIKYYLAL